jgi:5-bromo-4-chloroindolyl phosphate hydrolysis protein
VNRYRDIIAGAVGGVGFAAFYLAMGLGLPVSLALSAGAGVGTWLVFSGNRFRGMEIAEAEGLSGDEIQQMLESGERRAKEIERASAQVQDPQFRAGVDAALITVRKILDYLAKNPGRIKRARKFLSYYLDTTLYLVTRYRDLEASNDPEIVATRAKMLDVLGTIDAAFEKQLAVLLSNDVLDIDAEIEVLRSTLRTEGLTPDAN